jgi:hypothetical protein
MQFNGPLPEQAKIVNILSPLDFSTNAQTGDRVSLKDYDRVCFIATWGVAATGTPAITLQQATTAAGGSEKALTFLADHYLNAATGTDDTLVRTATTAGSITKTAVSNQMLVIDIKASALDVDNGFDWVEYNQSAAGGSCVGSVIAILYNGAQGNPPPTAVA